jgi:ribonuclease HI
MTRPLENIFHYVSALLADEHYDPHASTVRHLEHIQRLAEEGLDSPIPLEEVEPPGEWPEPPPEQPGPVEESGSLTAETDPRLVVCSCDASITTNPRVDLGEGKGLKGRASAGIVVRAEGTAPVHRSRELPKAQTINEAEYDAVYLALHHVQAWGATFAGRPVEVRSDSKLIVNQLNGEWKVKEDRLKRKRDMILELVAELVVDNKNEITFVWKPRNSTVDMKRANQIAQDLIGVENH